MYAVRRLFWTSLRLRLLKRYGLRICWVACWSKCWLLGGITEVDQVAQSLWTLGLLAYREPLRRILSSQVVLGSLLGQFVLRSLPGQIILGSLLRQHVLR